MAISFVVLEDVTLSGFLQYLIDHNRSPTTLIIYSSREAFLQELLHRLRLDASIATPLQDIEAHVPHSEDGSSPPRDLSNQQNGRPPLHPLLIPTLNLIRGSHTIKTAFCPELTHLLAYLSQLRCQSRSEQKECLQSDSGVQHTSSGKSVPQRVPLLAILNPIAIHKPTSAFSAQGLNRTFAAAVETALYLGQTLVMAECRDGSGGAAFEDSDEMELVEHGAAGPLTKDKEVTQRSDASPWDEEVSMLNVTTKSFGVGEKAWVGRTVSVRRIAERWCRFERMAP